MPKLEKKIVKLKDDKLRLVVKCFLNAVEKNNLKDSKLFLDKTKTSGFWSLLASLFPGSEGLKEKAIELLVTTEYEMHEKQINMDTTAEILYKEYVNFWVNVLKLNNLTTDETTSPEISNYNILIYELLRRMCADALSNNVFGENEGIILLNTMLSFIENIKSHRELLVEKTAAGLGPKHITEVAITLGTDHGKWMTWINEMVDSVKIIRAHILTVSKFREYLNSTQSALQKQLLAELATQKIGGIKELKWSHFHDDVFTKYFRDLEEQCIAAAQGKKPQNSKERAKLGKEKALQQAGNLSSSSSLLFLQEQSLQVIDSIDPTEVSALGIGTKKYKVSNLYNLINEGNELLSIICELENLNKSIGWVAIMTGAVKLDAIGNLFRDFIKRCTAELEVKSDAVLFTLNQSIALGLLQSNALSGSFTANLGMTAVTQLHELQSKHCLAEIGKQIKSSLNALLAIQSKYPGVELIDKKICGKLLNVILDDNNNQEENKDATAGKETIPTPAAIPTVAHRSSASAIPLPHKMSHEEKRSSEPSITHNRTRHNALTLKIYDAEIQFKNRITKTEIEEDKKFVHLYPASATKESWICRYWKKGTVGNLIRKEETISDEGIIKLLNQSELDQATENFLINYLLSEDRQRTELLTQYLAKTSVSASTRVVIAALAPSIANPASSSAPSLIVDEKKSADLSAQSSTPPTLNPAPITEIKSQRERRRQVEYLRQVKLDADKWEYQGFSSAFKSVATPKGILALREALNEDPGNIVDADIKEKMVSVIAILEQYKDTADESEKLAAMIYKNYYGKAEQDFSDLVLQTKTTKLQSMGRK